MRNKILVILAMMAAAIVGCYPEDFDKQTWGPEPELDLSAPGITLTPGAGKGSIEITSNYPVWEAEVITEGADWCSIAKVEKTLVVKASRNPGEKERTAAIEIRVGKGKTAVKQLAITQLGSRPRITANPPALAFKEEGGRKTFSVISNLNQWNAEVSYGSEWCRISKKGNEVEAEADVYTGKMPREAMIAISGKAADGSLVSATVKAIQSGSEPMLQLSEGSVSFQQEASEKTLVVATNIETWDVIIPSDVNWCKARKQENAILFTAESNETGTPRKFEATVKAGEIIRNFQIMQAGKAATLEFSTESLVIEGDGGIEEVGVLTDEGFWTASQTAGTDWCRIIQGENSFTVATEKNPSATQVRKADITVKAGNMTKILSVRQLPYISLSIAQDSISMRYNGGTESVTFNTNQASVTAIIPDGVTWCKATVEGNQLKITVDKYTGGKRETVVLLQAGNEEANKVVQIHVSQIEVTEREILMILYNATDGPNWKNNTNWGTDKPLNEWYGISTENIAGQERVKSIDLSGNYPTETKAQGLPSQPTTERRIPAELGQLTDLISLRLAHNQLTGNIPAELGKLLHLQELYLNNNQLTGNIPAELGKLLHLQELYLNNNQLTGNIPMELGKLVYLRYLDLNSNQLTGSIPAELGKLLHLQELYLNNNQLTGNIPVELGKLLQLDYVHLSNNKLTGNIPTEFGNLTKLTALYLSDNQVAGNIPADLGKLTKLTSLDLNNNKLTGNIPTDLGKLTKLISLNLSNNQLTGNIPVELGNLIQLTYFALSYNKLSGEIPDNLGNLSQLVHMFLHNNQLTGNIPVELGKLIRLKTLYLSNNLLTGTVPQAVVDLPNWSSFNHVLAILPQLHNQWLEMPVK